MKTKDQTTSSSDDSNSSGKGEKKSSPQLAETRAEKNTEAISGQEETLAQESSLSRTKNTKSEPPTGREDTLAQGGDSAAGSSSRPKLASQGYQLPQVGMQVGRYKLLEELGEGGMASVFLAEDTKLRRQVAVKLLFPHLAKRAQAAARFQREARAAARLEHQHIMRVLDVGGGESGQLPFIVLELIRGKSLLEFFGDSELPLAEVIAAIGSIICSALEHAHEAEIVHRDIKPANLMVDSEGRIVLADFGVARVGEEDSVVTRTGMLLGTPAYMSPEQAQGEKVDARSDIYSLGATLYHLASGAPPYSGSAVQVATAIVNGELPALEKVRGAVGRELSRVIGKMMSRNIDERFQSAKEAGQALDEIVQNGGFPDSEALIAKYFSGDRGSAEVQVVIGSLLRRSQGLASGGRSAAALALLDRVLELQPNHAQAEALVARLAREKKRPMWPVIVGPMIVTGIVGAIFWGHRPSQPSYYVDDDAGGGDASISDAAGSADAKSDRKDSQGQSERVFDAGVADAKSKAKVFEGSKASTKTVGKNRSVPEKGERDRIALVDAGTIVADAATADRASVEEAKPQEAELIVNIRPWCDLSIDQKAVGRASLSKVHRLAPGRHELRCEQSTTGLYWEEVVTLNPGEKRKLQGRLLAAKVLVQVALKSADAIVLDGKQLKNGGQISLAPKRYRVELLGGTKRPPAYISITSNCTLRDMPIVSCSSR